jgi:hypothetical protein
MHRGAGMLLARSMHRTSLTGRPPLKVELRSRVRASWLLSVPAALFCATAGCVDASAMAPLRGETDRIALRGGSGGREAGASDAGGRRTIAGQAGSGARQPAIDAGRGRGTDPDVQSTGPSCDIGACQSPSGSIFVCCLPDGSCGAGVNSECRELDQAGEPDARCPSQAAPGGAGEFAGCCRPDDRCGVDVGMGLGCIERSDLPSYLGGPLGPRRCRAEDPEDGGVADGGAEDGGA